MSGYARLAARGGRHALLATLVVGTACTRANPLFGAGDDPSGAGSGSGSAGTTTTRPDPPDPVGTTRSNTGDGEAGTTGVTGAGPGTATSGFVGSDTRDDGTTGPIITDVNGNACVFEPPYALIFDPPLGPKCGTEEAMWLEVYDDGDPFHYVVAICATCPCEADPDLEHQIWFDLPAPVDDTGCLRLTVQWGEADGVDSCSVDAYAFSTSAEGLIMMGSNVVDPTIAEPFNFALGPVVEHCGPGCAMDGSGYTPLVSADGFEAIEPGETLEVGVALGPFEVTNDWSGLSPVACADIGRWWAERIIR